MASTPDPSTMTRDELEQRVKDLEGELEELQALTEHIEIDDSGGDIAMSDIMIGGNPIGILIQQALEKSRDAHDRLDDLESGDGGGFSEATRDKMLPAHRMAVDIRNGHEDRIGADKRKRAAELFRRMMHKVDADGDPQPGVDNSGGSVTIKSSDAQEIIRAFDDDLEAVSSMQVTRAFRELQRLTKHEDCDCDDIDSCGHGIVIFQPGATNTVGANTQRLIDYLAGLDAIEAGANGDVSSGTEDGSASKDTDDAGNSVEGEADETFEQLAQADSAGVNGTANDVVSSNQRTTLADGDGHVSGDNHEA